jgi:hypothetical protein
MSFHRDLTTGDIHVIHDQTYADITARDADTVWNGDSQNIGKVVKVIAGPVFFLLEDNAPTWLEITTSVSNSLAGALAIGNTTGGSDIVIDTGDVVNITDAPILGTSGANKTYVDSQIGVNNELSEILANGNTTGGSDIVIDTGDVVNITDAPILGTSGANKAYVDSQIGVNNELSEILANGNTTGGSDIVINTGDVVNITDAPILGTSGANKTYVDGENATQDTAIGLNTTHRSSDGSDHSFINQDVTTTGTPTFGVTTLGDSSQLATSAAPTADEDIVNKLYVDGENTTQDIAIGLNTTHRSSDGSDHSFINQDVTTTGTPTFGVTTLGDSSQLATSAAPTSDEDIVNKLYVDGENATQDTAIGLNTTHRSSDGSDHSFINQDVTTTGTPTFGVTTLGDSSQLATSAAPTADVDIANKLYVDSLDALKVTGPASATTEALARFDGSSGKLIKNSNALLNDAGDLTIIGSILSETRKVSTNPAEIVEIFSAADFDALATAGVITVTTGTNLELRIKAFTLTTATRIEVEAGAQLILEGNRLSTIIYTGAGIFITGTTPAIRIMSMNLTAAGGGTLFSVASLDPLNAQVTIDRCVLVGWKMGSIDRTFLFFDSTIIFNWESGLDVTNFRIFGTTGLLFSQLDEVAVGDSLFKINSHDPKAVANLIFGTGRLPGGDFFISIDPGLHNESTVVIGSSVITGDMFDTSGITGSFTAVADATIAATVINSVIDSPTTPGIARFQFTVGPTVFVNQYVEISGFAHTAYNQNGLVTASGVGWFEVLPLQSGATGAITGSFRSDSITLTEAVTTASDGLGMTIDTDGATNYDGGAIAYNKQPGSFEIHRIWTATHTGSWSAEGLDFSDPRVIAQNNPGNQDSNYIASAYVNGNATVNPTITNTTYRDMAFGTAGSALVIGSNIERWELIDDVLGIFEYTGNEPLDGEISFSQTSTSAGGAVEFRWKWVHDIGAGYVDLPDPVIASNDIGASAQNTSFNVPLNVVKGDRIKPQITRMTGASTITVTHASISVQ